MLPWGAKWARLHTPRGETAKHLEAIQVWVLAFAVFFGFMLLLDGLKLFSAPSLLTARQRFQDFFIDFLFGSVVGIGAYPILGTRVWCRYGCPLAVGMRLAGKFTQSRHAVVPNDLGQEPQGLYRAGLVAQDKYVLAIRRPPVLIGVRFLHAFATSGRQLMRSIWGPVTEIRDLGVVAEQCPHCERVVPCLLRSVYRGSYVFFLKTAAPTEENSSLCTACLKALPCEHWRYAAVVPIRKAKALPIEELLARTNPGLAERLQLREQIRALGGDAAFGLAYEQVERLRPGALRSRLLKQLLGWNGLAGEQRTLLGQLIGAHARAWLFACQIAPAFPGQAGGWRAVFAALAVWSAFFWVPAIHSWLWGSITLVAGLVAAALTRQLLLTRNVCQWTRTVLIPEAQEANVSLACLLAVVEDVPGSRLGMMEDLWPIKNELEAIRRVLRAEGRL